MDINTRQFGLVTIDETKIITLPKGIPGFPDRKRFIILVHDEIQPFYSFQSVDDSDLAFIITDPFLFKADYVVDAEPSMKEMNWNADEIDEMFIYVIINATDPDPRNMTANLMGPLLINIKRGEAIQMIVSDTNYSNKYLIFSENIKGVAG